MLRQEILRKWHRANWLNCGKQTNIGATVRFRRQVPSGKNVDLRVTGSKKGKNDGRGPDPPQQDKESEGWRPRHKDRTKTDSDRTSGYWTGPEDSSDDLPLLAAADPFDDIEFGEVNLFYNMPFGFLKKKKTEKEQAPEAEFFLKDQGSDGTGQDKTTYGTQSLRPEQETGHGPETELLLLNDEDDKHSITADSGVESQAGESSKEPSPDPEPSTDLPENSSTIRDAQGEEEETHFNVTSPAEASAGPSLLLELQQAEDIPLMYDLRQKGSEESVSEIKDDILNKTSRENEESEEEKVEISLATKAEGDVGSCQAIRDQEPTEPAGSHQSEGSPLIGEEQRQKKKKMAELLCCTIL